MRRVVAGSNLAQEINLWEQSIPKKCRTHSRQACRSQDGAVSGRDLEDIVGEAS